MTWLEFTDLVKTFLTVDSDREGTQTYVANMIRSGVIDIQHHVPCYRIGHEALYLPGDFAEEGYASRGTLPPEGKAREMWWVKVYEDGTSDRHPVEQVNFKDRFEFVHGVAQLNQVAKVAIDPQGYTFWIYPKIEEGIMISIIWDGTKLDEFQDAEETPFDENMAPVVAHYVKAHVVREFQQDHQGFKSYMDSYEVGRRRLIRDSNEKASLHV